MSSAISIESLSMEYGAAGSGHLALDTVSLEIRDNEFFTLLGPSGCGKTTLLRLIAGFEQPSAGVIRLYGQPMQDLPPFRRPVNTVFQSYALFPHMKVLENVAFGPRMQGLSRAARRARAGEMLELVHLSAAADQPPAELSGGMQQRVALARALAPRPRVLLMDEPFSGLDERLRDGIRDETLALLKDEGTAVLLVTHEPDEAMRMADLILLMRSGRIVQRKLPSASFGASATGTAAGLLSTSACASGRVMKTTAAARIRPY